MSVFDSLPSSSQLAAQRRAEKDKARAEGLAAIRGAAKSECAPSLSGETDKTVPIVNASSPESVPIVNARSDCQRADDGWLIPCECGCGEMVKVKPQYVSKAHRQRAYRRRPNV